MKVIQLVRPALDPRRELALRMRESQAGLADFVLSVAPPAGWLSVELLDEPEPAARPEVPRASRRG